MKYTNVILRMLCFGISGALACAAGAVLAQGPAACDTCQDLCRLMDQYQQRVKAIEIWQKYTGDGGRHVPGTVKTQDDMENLFQEEFNQWLDSRRLPNDASGVSPGSLPCIPKRSGGGAVGRILVDPADCKIYVKNPGSTKQEELVGAARDAYEASVNCKADSDAEIAHEEVHKKHCENAHAIDPAGGEAFMRTPWMTAESELDAYTRQRDMLHDDILSIVRNKGCGWDPTARQKQDPDSIPSLKQVQDMSQRAWQAAEALSDGGVHPPEVGVSGGVSP